MEHHPRADFPTAGWKRASAQEVGADPARLEQARARARELTCLHSLLLIRSGLLLFEEYAQGWHLEKYHNIMSCTKTIVASLVGIALGDGLLRSVDQPLLDFFPEYCSATTDPRKQAITLRHLLTMTSGYGEPNASGEAHDIAAFLEESASLPRILDRPMQHNPGQVYCYDNMNPHLLGHVLSRVTGMSLAQFAYTRLFQPLGIWQDEAGTPSPWRQNPSLMDDPHPFGLWDQENRYLWSIDRSGHFIGSFGLQLTPRDMAKYGYLSLKQGRWDNQQIIPMTYVQETMQYGYIKQHARWHEHDIFFNTGALGQFLAVVPDLDLVAVMTGFCMGHDHLQDLFVDLVLPSFL